jgi:ferric-dicitrate binding protein FerR (iron transport regulator)
VQFTNAPLAVVVEQANRYSPVPIELRGDALQALEYTGTVVAGRTEDWLRGLPDVYPVRVRDAGAAGYVIESLSAKDSAANEHR